MENSYFAEYFSCLCLAFSTNFPLLRRVDRREKVKVRNMTYKFTSTNGENIYTQLAHRFSHLFSLQFNSISSHSTCSACFGGKKNILKSDRVFGLDTHSTFRVETRDFDNAWMLNMKFQFVVCCSVKKLKLNYIFLVRPRFSNGYMVGNVKWKLSKISNKISSGFWHLQILMDIFVTGLININDISY